MAERRMISSKIVCSDAFTEMPFSAQALYYQLNMAADDDGFLNSPKRVVRMLGASEADLSLLLEKRFVLGFANGVIAIKHWRINNQIRKDRYTPTQYKEEFNTLAIRDDGAYTERKIEAVDDLATTWQPDGNHLATQVRLGKDSIGKGSIDILPEAEPAPATPDPPTPPDPPEEKGKKGRKKSEIVQPIADYSGTDFSDSMIATIEKWLKYKTERRDAYKPTGLQSLISKIQNETRIHGEQAVIKVITDSMASNYQGIVWDRLQQQASRRGGGNGQNENLFLQMRDERRGRG